MLGRYGPASSRHSFKDVRFDSGEQRWIFLVHPRRHNVEMEVTINDMSPVDSLRMWMSRGEMSTHFINERIECTDGK